MGKHSRNKGDIAWGTLAVYLFDEFGGRPLADELVRAVQMRQNDFIRSSTPLIQEAIILYGDIKEDYFRSPSTCAPAPWLFNSPELFVLFKRPELEVSIPFNEGFFKAVVKEDFLSFSDFLKHCYPELSLPAVPSRYEDYSQKVKGRRKENSGAWDDMLMTNPKFFYEHIRPMLVEYSRFLDDNVKRVTQQEVGTNAPRDQGESVPDLIGHLLADLMRPATPSVSARMDSLFPTLYQYNQGVLDARVRKLFESFQKYPPQTGLMGALKRAIDDQGLNPMRTDIMWAGRRGLVNRCAKRSQAATPQARSMTRTPFTKVAP